MKILNRFTPSNTKTHIIQTHMKKFIAFTAILSFLVSCGGSSDKGELVGVKGKKWHPEKPFGMTLVPGGAFIMGRSSDDQANSQDANTKTVTVRSFYMDETEISNSEYRQFVEWVKDSTIRVRLANLAEEEGKEAPANGKSSSKTGSIVYIEPQETLVQSRKLQDLIYDEEQEVKRILKELTAYLNPFIETLSDYQNYLTHIDVVYSKAKYADEISAIKPNFSKEKNIKLKNAFHPLLYTSNKKQNITTYPQTIGLDKENRIIVISGPNAGGKSITLKTIGLLQLMVQSGILVPVHQSSEISIFKNIISDIGDNQSIENQLSTYSYRLKNMNSFLRKCNSDTLFLIDEFGTGSDPELGGALAEIFLEVFYERESFGVITTHYSNLKLLADELPYMSNANMQFNDKTLEPIFNLVVGQAGSSFTFEVAQKNGIPYSIINRAKKKIERGKVRFDATIVKLQKQRMELDKTTSSLKDEESKFRKEKEKLNQTNDKIKSKLINYQELFDSNQRMIVLGNKLNDIAQRYFNDNKKRNLVSEVIKLVDTLNSKRKKTNFSKNKLDKIKKKRTAQILENELKDIRKEKKRNKNIVVPKKNKVELKIGDKVRFEDSRSIGTIDKIEKNKAIVNYGTFITKVDLIRLDIV